MSELVVDVGSVRATDLPLVGGKGANLGELSHAGAPVPPAFCVTTRAYEEFVAHNDLAATIAGALARGVGGDGAAEASMAIQHAFLAAEVPAPVRSAVVDAYRLLGSGTSLHVSVRSSATAEDLPGTSFAGQQDTYLHMHGSDAVVDAVRRCWASLWTARAIAYRDAQGFAHGEVRLAVVVQEMFASQVAGVLFTANPTTSNPFQLVVNASWGLGEAVVSGHVDPDQFVVERDSLAVVAARVGAKEHMTVPTVDGQGTVLAPTPVDLATRPSLTDDAVQELCRLGLAIEEHYGTSQDIEWGWADGRFAVLQAREITGADLDFSPDLETWKSPEALAQTYDERWLWSRAYSDDVQTGPTTPSFYTYLQAGMTTIRVTALELAGCEEFLGYPPDRFADIPYFRWYGARAYYNLDVERERIRRFIPPFARDEATLWPFPESDRDAVRTQPFDWPEFWQLLVRLHRERYDVSLLGCTQVVYDNLERWTDEEAAFWEGVDLDQATVQQIFDAQRASRRGSRFGENVALPFTIYLFVLPQALRTLCASWLDDDGTLADLLLTGIRSKTSEENERLWELSRLVRADPALASEFDDPDDRAVLDRVRSGEDDRTASFREALDQFVGDHYQRGGAERDPVHPRWGDDPSLVLRSMRPLLALGDEDAPQIRDERAARRVAEARAHAVSRLADGRDGSLRSAFFGWFVDLVRDYAYYRDFERFYNDRTMSRSRRLYAAIGRRLVASGLLADPDDVYFLGRHEMLAADDGLLTARQVDARIRTRRAVHEKYRHREPPKYIRGWTFFDDDSVTDGGLRGIGASGGVVTGTARVCRELSQITSLRKGDILVSVATDPGWTAVFGSLGGIVVETGGVVAHAVMIAREYGRPCVSNVVNACERIPDGATITIDGRTGVVRVDAIRHAEERSAEFDADSAALWAVVSDFAGIGRWWPGGFASVEVHGPAARPIGRVLRRHDGSEVSETLVELSDVDRALVLRIDSGLPSSVEDYTCRYVVRDSPGGGSTLHWSPSGLVRCGDEAEFATIVDRGWAAVTAGLGSVL